MQSSGKQYRMITPKTPVGVLMNSYGAQRSSLGASMGKKSVQILEELSPDLERDIPGGLGGTPTAISDKKYG